ncbi:MAG TPA: hypothetical protein VKZ50_05120 [bacterium]|nr:hypothetical protein [bacterium]
MGEDWLPNSVAVNRKVIQTFLDEQVARALIAKPLAFEALLSEFEGAVGEDVRYVPNLFIGGKAFAGLYGDAMVFKLDGPTHARTLALSRTPLFDPSGRGRSMKAWVQVPLRHTTKWPTLTREALRAISEQ